MATQQVTGDSAIGAAVERLKAASEIVNFLVVICLTGEVQSKILDLQTAFKEALPCAIAAQDNQKALLTRISWLKERLAASQDWEAERATYELQRFDPGVFAYRRKQSAITADQQMSAEAQHLLCPNCFDNRRKSILQSTTRIERRYPVHACPECQNEYAFYYGPDGASV